MKHSSYSDLVDVLNRSVAKHAQRNLFGTKVDGSWEWITYGAFGKRVDDLRGGLAELGIGQGDTVAIISANRVEWAVAAYATYSLGARFCPMYESQTPKDWQYILEDSGAKVLFTSTYQIFEQTRGWTQELDSLGNVFCMALPEEDVTSFGSLEVRGRSHPAEQAEIDPEWICGFIYTSGTTGKPKGVLLSHSNICANINGVSSILPVDHADVSVSFLPWAHSFGQTCELHCLISRGAAMAIAESIDKLVDNFGEVRPTLLFAVPRIFNRIYDGLQKRMEEEGGLKKMLFEAGMANAEKRKQLAERGETSWLVEQKHKFFDGVVFSKVRDRFGGRLKYACSGGAALSPEVADFIDKLGIMVCEGYGLTETSPICTTNHPGARKIGSVGQAIPGVEVIIDTSVLDDPDSEDGEIVIKGANVMKGYHNLPEETAKVIGEDGSFRTGDMGRLDDDGFLYITGRIKEQYKLENGKYVVPAPLEDLLQLSPFVVQAFIHGFNKPHNVALIVPDQDALLKWARDAGVKGSVEELIENPRVKKLMTQELEQYSTGFKGYERVRNFKMLTEEFSVENSMLTPKLSIKRKVVMDRYDDDLEALYDE